MAAVRGRARNAEVYAINYPDPVRPLPGHCAALGVELPKDWVSRHLGLSEANETHGLKIDTPEQRWISETFLPALNKSVAGAAHNQGFHLLDVSDAFRGRGICREDPYSHGLTLGNDKLGKGGVGILGNESFHPTPIGQDRLAAMFEARFKVDDVGRIPNLAPNTLTAFEDPDTLQIAISGDYVFTASGATTVLIENAPANEVILVSTYSLGGVAGRGKTDANGNASIPIRIPPSAAPGLHHLEIWTQSGRRLGAEPFLVGGSEACVGKPDVDGDSLTDLCDTDPKDGALADFDGDGVLNGTDVCPLVADVAQTDTDDDGEGNACDPDSGASLFQTGLRGPLTPGVSGPPSAPRNVQAVPVDAGRVKVTWQAPETDGGAALTAYRLRTSAAGTATDVAASNSSAVLAGLPAGSTLKIAVQAVNGAGAGAVALTAPVTVPKAPPGKGGGGGTTGGGGGTTGGGGGGTTGGGGGSTGGGQLGETAESSRVRLLAPKFDRRGKALTLKVKCLAADGRCTGRLDVLMGKRKLGTVKYSVAAGKSVKLRVKLRARPSKAVVVKAYAAKKKTPVATLKVRKPKR